MLTLRHSDKCRKIAVINEDKKDVIYLKEEDDGEPEIETTEENKVRILKNYLHLDKKLNSSDIETLLIAYKNQTRPDVKKLDRKYDDAVEFINHSLKTYLDFGTSSHLFPVVEDESYRIFVSGLSGSGKSYFISQFLKHNKPRVKGAGIFLFSPILEDKAYSGIKNLIHLDLDEFKQEMKGEDLTIEDVPEGSIVVWDDVESFPKHSRKQYMDLRDIMLERGRHRKISLITVSHNATNGNATKSSIRESQYWVLFPRHNSRDSKNILKIYGGLEKSEIDMVMALKTRWVFYRKAIPKYLVAEHTVIAF
jgi:hypothetical protein